MCGFKRPPLSTAQPLAVAPDISTIDGRLDQLRGIALSSAYAKQRESLKKEFSAFLCSLPGAKTLFSATPKDVCRFLAWKDSRGKTQVHVSTCPFLGKHKVHSCRCPVRLSYATVDSYIGKLRAIFKDAGREGDWNTALSLGNPAASAEVKAYLKAFTSEQLQAAVTPKQATPLFLVKIVPLSRLIQRKMLLPGITASQLFVYARDAAFFKTLFFSGDRANDLTLVKTQEIMRFPQNDGLLFNHVWGKSLRDGSANLFGIRRHSDSSLCPVKAIELYIGISSALSLDLLSGFLFRPLNSLGKIQNKQLASSTLQSRLRSYLQEADIYNGATLHSFRAGLAITLALSGSQLADIMEHVGWRHAPTASHYLKVAQVLRPGGPSDLLSRHDPSAQALAVSYTDLNSLRRFTVAFPTGSSP